ncbi:MFS transporter [Nonomuraea turcica]|uniref:MFS transporter n=1 Tax=Nonomuraea sp. G32 TaxID=3067274 RepID=UPI00273BEBF9|nr:MFS transporter [Nonomuraea sp. G32]MDP4511829.1 MFS transporter [Nonomuraea sp. G32]
MVVTVGPGHAVASPRPRASAGASHRRPSSSQVLVRAVGAAVTGLVMADTLASTLVLPLLGQDPITRGVPLAQLSLLTTAYLAAIAALLTPAGRLADLIGRRAVLAVGLAVFTAGAFTMAFASSWALLLIARLAQGVAAAMMLPSALGLLLSRVGDQQRRGAAALWGAATGAGGLVAHAFGGLMADTHGWRALYLPVGTTAVALLLLVAALPRTPAGERRPLNVVGMLASAAAIAAAVLLLSCGGSWGWTSPATLAAAAVMVSGTSLALARTRRPPVGGRAGGPAGGGEDAPLWRCPGFSWGLLTSLLYGLLAFPLLAVAPLVLREGGMSPTSVGVALAPLSAAVMLASTLVARAARRAGTSWMVYAGAYLSAIGLVVLYVAPQTSLGALAGLVVTGVGFGFISTTATIAGTLGVAPSRYATAIGSITTARMLGGAIGPAAALAYLTSTGQDPGEGYPDVLAGGVGLSLLLGVLSLARRIRHTKSAAVISAPPAPPALAALAARPGEVERLRQTLQRQRARLEAIARTAEEELITLSTRTDSSRGRAAAWNPSSSFAPPPQGAP